MATNIRTHLMFDGIAFEAMNFYVGLFPMSEVIDVSHYVIPAVESPKP
jgi:predicted 3-demethylubiquinone-9 3-methyltransferase (glyoxalase superfamily)